MDTNLSLEKIVRLVTEEVMRELGRKGAVAGARTAPVTDPAASVRLDMSGYRTPIVTEHALLRLHERAVSIIVPAGAIITPRAKEIVRERNLSVVFE